MLIYADCFIGLTLDGSGFDNADMVRDSMFEIYIQDLPSSDQIVCEVNDPRLIEKLHRDYGIVGYDIPRIIL